MSEDAGRWFIDCPLIPTAVTKRAVTTYTCPQAKWVHVSKARK